MSNLTNRLRALTTPLDDCSVPVFFRLRIASDRADLSELLEQVPSIIVMDQINMQLRDLVKLENPSKTLSEEAYISEINKKLSGLTSDDYGVWVYYPWRCQLIHLLDEEEFIRVRTIRNAYKITFEEQAILRTKKIGVIGLSVGQSVSLALAMERIAGEIRIADFDTLELSNMNRIRTGTSSLGLPKTAMVAREIAEIDPFIKVVCYNDGITKDNVDSFFDTGGRLDLLIEECDGIEVKILARERAKEKKVPVIMSMSDRGMLDVERYDEISDYPILHGLVPENVSYDFLKGLKSSQDKLPFMLPIIGTDSLSTRLKSSAIEIGETITTWPQLASDVILDGAICAHTSRKILLGAAVASRRQWIDLDEIIYADKTHTVTSWISEGALNANHAKGALDVHDAISENHTDEEVIRYILLKAIKAPSPGNHQKWKWLLAAGGIYCFIDKQVSYSFADNLNWGSIVAIGATLVNIELAASDLGFEAQTELLGETSQIGKPIAKIEFRRNSSIIKSELGNYIEARNTYRGIPQYRRSILEEHRKKLLEAGDSIPSIHCHIVEDYALILELGKLISQGDRFRFLNAKGHHEFFNGEIRWSAEEAISAADGLDITQFPLSELDRAGLALSKSPDTIKLVKELGGGKAFEKISKRSFETADALAIITINEWNSTSLLKAGKAMQRFWLTAESLGIGIQPMTVLQALFTFRRSNEHGFVTEKEIEFIDDLRQKFHLLSGLDHNKESIFLCRIAYKESAGFTAPRIPLNQKLILT